MANQAIAPEIPPHDQDIPLVDEIENFDDPFEDPLHVELDRILLRMLEDDENAPGIPPHVEDIPLIDDILEYIDIPVYLEVQQNVREMEPDQNVPEIVVEDVPAFPPPLFFEPQDIDFVDIRQEAAVVEAVNVFAVAMVENEPQVYQAEDVLQHNMPAAREPESPIAPPQGIEEAVPGQYLNGQISNATDNERKRKATVHLEAIRPIRSEKLLQMMNKQAWVGLMD